MRPDEWEANPYHAHIGWNSRDCDGQYEGGHIFRRSNRKDPDQIQREWGDWLELWEELLTSVAMIPDVGQSNITISESDKGGYTFYANQETEEGYRVEVAQMCQDPWCDLEEKESFRDHTAESMGY